MGKCEVEVITTANAFSIWTARHRILVASLSMIGRLVSSASRIEEPECRADQDFSGSGKCKRAARHGEGTRKEQEVL